MSLHKPLPLVFFLYLNAFVLPVWSNSSKDNDSCVQKTVEGHCCELPFDHDGKTYYTCTKDDSGVLGIGSYFWCYYNNTSKTHGQCKGNNCSSFAVPYNEQAKKEEPIYHPTSAPSTIATTEETTTLPHLPYSLNVSATQPTSVFPPTIPSKNNTNKVFAHSTSLPSSPSPRHTSVLATSKTEEKSSLKTKRKMYIVLACGIAGGIILAIFIAVTIIIYSRRKSRIKVKKEDEGDQHELNSYRMRDEANNPVYESIDKDLNIDVNDADEQQALQPPHVYHELEKPRGSTIDDGYSIPNVTLLSNRDGPKITPALNDTDCLTHLNEIYETN